MEPVTARALAPTRTAAELTAAGASVHVVAAGLTAPRVDLAAPREVAAELRAALAWRVEAMVAAGQAAARTETRAWALPTLVAVPGLRGPRAGTCASCGEPHAEHFASGDCVLCGAARIAALRQLGRLGPPVALVPAEPDDAWHRLMGAPRTPGVVLPAQPHPAWTCGVCGARVEGLPVDPDGECGPCQIKRQSIVDTSRLGGRHA